MPSPKRRNIARWKRSRATSAAIRSGSKRARRETELASHKDSPVLRLERRRLKGQMQPVRMSAVLSPETQRARSRVVIEMGRYHRSDATVAGNLERGEA